MLLLPSLSDDWSPRHRYSGPTDIPCAGSCHYRRRDSAPTDPCQQRSSFGSGGLAGCETLSLQDSPCTTAQTAMRMEGLTQGHRHCLGMSWRGGDCPGDGPATDSAGRGLRRRTFLPPKAAARRSWPCTAGCSRITCEAARSTPRRLLVPGCRRLLLRGRGCIRGAGVVMMCRGGE